jgi:hypothetical protein
MVVVNECIAKSDRWTLDWFVFEVWTFRCFEISYSVGIKLACVLLRNE